LLLSSAGAGPVTGNTFRFVHASQEIYVSMDVGQLLEGTEDESFSRATRILIDTAGIAIRSPHSCGQLPIKALSGAINVVELFQRCTEVLACSSFASKPILKCWL
jgi:hypothetical protein